MAVINVKKELAKKYLKGQPEEEYIYNINTHNVGPYYFDKYGKCSSARIGSLKFYYSYNTLVAFEDLSNGIFLISKNQWGKTTGKHLNWINDDKSIRIPYKEFLDKVNNILNNYKLINVA